MTDIHAIIAAAKRVWQQQQFDGKDAALYIALGDARIAMAEALARIAANACCDKCQEAALVARDCLDQIVKEAP